MTPELRSLLDSVAGTGTFAGATLDHVNATNSDGDNALHWAATVGDLQAATLLIEAGIEVNKHGDLGYTPLHNACAAGHKEMVLLLLQHGADLYALTEGDPPFALARKLGMDHICELLRPLMQVAQRQDPNIWLRVRIQHLRGEVGRLEGLLRQ